MDPIRFLIRGFDYDLWANRQWLGALAGFRDLERVHRVMEHMLEAQRIWLERCGVLAPAPDDNVSMSDLFLIYSRTWISLVEGMDLNEPITYQNLRGEEFTQPLGDIVLHVLNHGTYHRGHLRGLAESEGNASFPETDMILFLRERIG
ncbi:MAG: DinB family protein [Fimbriimonadales bacterium]